jgi:hypothetical protein
MNGNGILRLLSYRAGMELIRMTYHTIDGEFEIDINGNEVPVRRPLLTIPNIINEIDPYNEYGHCPYDLGVRLIKIKGSLHRCPICGGYFSVSKNREGK